MRCHEMSPTRLCLVGCSVVDLTMYINAFPMDAEKVHNTVAKTCKNLSIVLPRSDCPALSIYYYCKVRKGTVPYWQMWPILSTQFLSTHRWLLVSSRLTHCAENRLSVAAHAWNCVPETKNDRALRLRGWKGVQNTNVRGATWVFVGAGVNCE